MEPIPEEVAARRHPGHDIAPLIVSRWSPRSLIPEPLPDSELLPLFEAARWAPSCFNAQPWRFIVGRRQYTAQFERFVGLLTPANRVWAANAAALVVVVSRRNFQHNEKPNPTYAFDAGAAWENLALEASRRGLVAHGMRGFDAERASEILEVPEGFEVLAMIAIGRRAPAGLLPEKLRAMEQPNQRRPLGEILFEGGFDRPFPGLP